MNTNWSRGLFEALAALLLAGGLCACSSHSAGDAALTETSPGASEAAVTTPSLPARRPAIEELNAAIPPLPPDGPRRNPSVNASVNRSGIEAIDSYSSALFDLPSQTLTLPTEADSNELSLCWAIYEFENLLPDTLPAMLETELAGELPGEYYIGVSDYALGGWRWRHISAPDGQDSAVATASSISPQSGSLYCVIAAFGGETLRIRKLSLLGDIALPPPAGFSASRDVQPRIVLSWEDPALSYDPDGDGPGTFDYSSITLMSAMDVHGPWQVLATLPKGSTTYYVYPHPQSGLPQIGQAMFFRLITNTPLAAGVPGNAELGLRKLATPTGLNATPGTYMDRVSLSWNSMAEAERYEVFARPVGQDSSALVYLGQTASQPQFSHWFNYPALFPAEDGVDYEYQVRAVHANGSHSELSAVAVGSRKTELVKNVQASDNAFTDRIEVSWIAVSQPTRYAIRFRRAGYPQDEYVTAWTALNDSNYQIFSYNLLRGVPFEFSVAPLLENGLGPEATGPFSASDQGEYTAQAKPVLRILPNNGGSPLQVILDGTESDWPAETIVSYGWDFENDGLIDATTSAASIVHDYPKGRYTAAMTITTAQGMTATMKAGVLSGGWIRSWSYSENGERADNMAVGPDGSIYSAGLFEDDAFTDAYTVLLLKRNSLGQLIWARRIGPCYDYFYTGRRPEIRFAAGSVWVLFKGFGDGATREGLIVARIDPDGSLLWSSQPDFGDFGTSTYVRSFCVDSIGRSYLGGYVTNSSSSYYHTGYIGCLDPDGSPLWLRQITNTQDPAKDSFYPAYVSADSSGRVVLFGEASLDPDPLNRELALLAMDFNGTLAWQIGWSELDGASSAGMSTSPNGNTVVAWLDAVGSTLNYQKLASIDSNGVLNWVKTPYFDGGKKLQVQSLFVDKSNQIVVSLNGVSGSGYSICGAFTAPASGAVADLFLWNTPNGTIPARAIADSNALFLCSGATYDRMLPVQGVCALSNDSIALIPSQFETVDFTLTATDAGVLFEPVSGTEDVETDAGEFAMMLRVDL